MTDRGRSKFEKTIAEMTVGEKGYTVPGALIFDLDGTPYLNTQFIIEEYPIGTLKLQIVRIGHGVSDYNIDLNGVDPDNKLIKDKIRSVYIKIEESNLIRLDDSIDENEDPNDYFIRWADLLWKHVDLKHSLPESEIPINYRNDRCFYESYSREDINRIKEIKTIDDLIDTIVDPYTTSIYTTQVLQFEEFGKTANKIGVCNFSQIFKHGRTNCAGATICAAALLENKGYAAWALVLRKKERRGNRHMVYIYRKPSGFGTIGMGVDTLDPIHKDLQSVISKISFKIGRDYELDRIFNLAENFPNYKA